MLLEREKEIEQLRAAPAGAVLAVHGEAGAGKTALVREALGDAPTAWGFCDPLTTPRPLGPFRDIARACGIPSGDLYTLAERLLDRLVEEPVTLVVEDAHWIDQGSAELLRFLARRLPGTRGRLVVTFRDDIGVDHPLPGVWPADTVRVSVQRLSPSAVATLVAGSPIDPAEAIRLAGGNAFLTTQLAAGSSVVGATVRDTVRASMARLPRPSMDLVDALSVVPGRVGAALIGERWPHLDAAVQAGLLDVDGTTVTFRHELVRLAVEDGLPPGRRRELHAAVLDVLASAPDAEPADVAHHAWGAHDLDRAWAAERLAGERAAALGAHHEAAAHYRRCVAAADQVADPEVRSRLWLRTAEEQELIGRTTDALTAARTAATLTANPGPALRRMSRWTTDEKQANELARRALDLAADDRQERRAAVAALAALRMLARDLDQALELARPLVVEAEEAGDDSVLIAALETWGSARLLQGHSDGADLLHRAIALASQIGTSSDVGRLHSNLVSGAGEGRLYDIALAAVPEASAYFRSRDEDASAGYTRAWYARCLFELGRWPEATALVDEILDDPAPALPRTRLLALCLQARIAIRTGIGGSPAGLAESLSIAGQTGALQRLAPVMAAAAEAAWWDHGVLPDGVEDCYQRAVGLENAWATGELGFWLWRHGRIADVPDFAAEPYRLHVRGEFAAAAEWWLRIGCPYEAAEAWTDGSRIDDWTAAMQIYARLGARRARQRTARHLRLAGVDSVPRGPSPATARHPQGLTAREQEIAALLGNGVTDAEIAAALHLSVRTVEHHVAAVLRKTGAATRRQLRDPAR